MKDNGLLYSGLTKVIELSLLATLFLVHLELLRPQYETGSLPRFSDNYFLSVAIAETVEISTFLGFIMQMSMGKLCMNHCKIIKINL